MNELKNRYETALQKGETFILTEEDVENFEVDNTGKEIKTIDDLIMVHKTSFFPEGAIKTPFDTKRSMYRIMRAKIDGEEKEYRIPVVSYRKSVHFCLNGSVKSHSYGNWDSMKYAILMPLAKNKDKIVGGRECDLFTQGSVSINSDAYILCPESEVSRMKEANPTANVIGYEGKSVSPYVNMFLSQVLGYKYKVPTQESREWDSGRGIDYETVESIIKENGWEYIDHNGSKWDFEDRTRQKNDMLINYLKIISNEKMLYKEENISEVRKLIIDGLHIGGLQPFTVPAIFKQIVFQVKQETGIDMMKNLTSEFFSQVTWGEEMLEKLANSIIKQMRKKILIAKEQENQLTEMEKLQLQHERIFGEENNQSLETIRADVVQYEKLLDRDISSLSDEELKVVLKVLNMKLSVLNQRTIQNNQIFQVNKLHEITKEEAEIFKSAGEYVVTRKEGIYLKFRAPNIIERVSSLTTINLLDINNKINSARDEELYQAMRNFAEVPGSRFIDFENRITDCDLLSCETVRELSDRVMMYAKAFEQFYNGEKIDFDKKGNVIPQEEHLGLATHITKTDDIKPDKQKEELLKLRSELTGEQTIENQSGYSI